MFSRHFFHILPIGLLVSFAVARADQSCMSASAGSGENSYTSYQFFSSSEQLRAQDLSELMRLASTEAIRKWTHLDWFKSHSEFFALQLKLISQTASEHVALLEQWQRNPHLRLKGPSGKPFEFSPKGENVIGSTSTEQAALRELRTHLLQRLLKKSLNLLSEKKASPYEVTLLAVQMIKAMSLDLNQPVIVARSLRGDEKWGIEEYLENYNRTLEWSELYSRLFQKNSFPIFAYKTLNERRFIEAEAILMDHGVTLLAFEKAPLLSFDGSMGGTPFDYLLHDLEHAEQMLTTRARMSVEERGAWRNLTQEFLRSADQMHRPHKGSFIHNVFELSHQSALNHNVIRALRSISQPKEQALALTRLSWFRMGLFDDDFIDRIVAAYGRIQP